jgi:hypothetical protein
MEDRMAFKEDNFLTSANLCRWVIDYKEIQLGKQVITAHARTAHTHARTARTARTRSRMICGSSADGDGHRWAWGAMEWCTAGGGRASRWRSRSS